MNERQTSKEMTTSSHMQREADFLNAEWLATLSHELRSPLTTIQGFATMLLRYDTKLSSDERHEYLQSISEGCSHLAGLLDTLFELAQFESGHVKLHPTTVDLVPLLQEIITTWPHMGPEYTSVIETRIAVQQEPESSTAQQISRIEADRSLLRLLIVQLLENALKYSPDDSPIEVVVAPFTLTHHQANLPAHISIQIHTQNQPLLELRIQDHGRGIPAEYHTRIFDRFQRVDLQLTRDVNGLGLGLTICRHIVMLHHGSIWVESTPEVGSTFHVLLPIQRSNEQ